MRDQQPKNEAKSAQKDITPVLKGWDYEPGTINVRKVTGVDGSPKLQMRLGLGLLQMEMNGRPDGTRPHGYESLLDYFEQQLTEHRDSHGVEHGFSLNAMQCELLREEAAMYYHRYLSLFVLEEFSGVVRDTARNLRLLDLCSRYADEEQDRLILEQYRPYIIMMHARARAKIYYDEQKYAQAIHTVEAGLASIKDFFGAFGQETAYGRSNEVRVLKRLAKEIRRKLPVDPMEKLRRRLDKAVKSERYEEAAKLRDKIVEMERAGGEGETSTASVG